MALYKYVVPGRIDILLQGLIRFTPRSGLNDAFEMSPFFRDVTDPEGMRKAFEASLLQSDSGISNEASPALSEKVTSTVRQAISRIIAETNLTLDQALSVLAREFSNHLNKEYALSMREEMYADISYKIGVLCLTDRPNNALMWGHYAKGHYGFVIEFDETHPFFDLKEKVKYSRRKPRRKAFKDLTWTELFLTKSKDWQYEHEWRVVRRLAEAKDIINHPQIGKIYRFEIPPECIKGIILGSKMSPEVIMNLKANDARYASIKLSRAQISDRTYNLNIIKL